MTAPSPLKALLKEQTKDLDAIGQHPVHPRDFLSSVSPLLNENSPARSRGASANGVRRTISPTKTSSTVGATSPTKSTEVAVVSPSRGAGPVPVAPDAYMNDLPLAPYGSTAHLSLHVRDTLQLALRVLRKSQQVGRVLTEEERQLVDAIALFSAPVVEERAVVEDGQPDAPVDGVQDFQNNIAAL
ncbi:Hypothetical protein, putative [Bodo saltans]|uniref:Uncharacterized protein n=1 Tax=Bodo saltans TaxID=75058 RepID=A0A0S4JQL8_BODSA|nr:Hypothetical protein, putative [Bodo saltans]|eukprot:CUG92257.1 Hypothetical protein, putative [Bodo saltans]